MCRATELRPVKVKSVEIGACAYKERGEVSVSVIGSGRGDHAPQMTNHRGHGHEMSPNPGRSSV
jgi:hypothetical protein